MTEDHTELAEVVSGFPDHRTLGRALQDGVNQTMLRFREERGEIHSPEDVFATVRWMQDTAEKFGDYGMAFAGAAKLIGQYVEETLVDAVGEQAGIPSGNLTVPTADGDIVLAADHSNQYAIDTEALHAAVAFEVIESTDLHNSILRGLGDTFDTGMLDGSEEQTLHEALDNALASALIAAMKRIADLGKFEPQVSKVRAFAKQLARAEADGVSATVSGAISKTTVYKGVRMTRKCA